MWQLAALLQEQTRETETRSLAKEFECSRNGSAATRRRDAKPFFLLQSGRDGGRNAGAG